MLGSFDKLRRSLKKTKDSLVGKISSVVSRRKIDDDLLDEIEQILIEADVGLAATERLIEKVRSKSAETGLTDGEAVLGILRSEIVTILSQSGDGLSGNTHSKPVIWLIVGVNGVGKTTTIGKLASHFANNDKKVLIAACDTFRAAAIDQIAIWAERSGVDIIKSKDNADPAAIAFDAARAAAARSVDLLLIDTAGRLHTKANLMEELSKIKRVIGKALPEATVLSKLIIDGSTGQNAIDQARVFTEAVGCDGIIVTKLDGTAKGGVMIALTQELEVPIDFIGLGEGIDDLQPFDPSGYAQALLS